MNDSYAQALGWLSDPVNWAGPTGIIARTGIYLGHCLLTLAIASLIAIPLGLWVGHTGRLRAVMVPLSGALRSLPTLGFLSALSLTMGLGLGAPLVALTTLAIAPILAGAYAGVESVDRELVDASRAIGFTERQILTRVEIPLAMPIVVSGLRSAAVQILASWTVAAYLPIEGLGRYLIDGLAMHDYTQMLAGSAVVIVLELAANALFGALERAVSASTRH